MAEHYEGAGRPMTAQRYKLRVALPGSRALRWYGRTDPLTGSTTLEDDRRHAPSFDAAEARRLGAELAGRGWYVRAYEVRR